MIRRTHIATCCVLALLACARDPAETAVLKAFDGLMSALERGDTDLLWALADETTRTRFDELARQIVQTETLVDAHLPEDQRDEARVAIGRKLIGPAAEGRALFAAVLDPSKLAPPQDPKARRVDRVEITHDEARLFLESGDVLAFARAADGSWRTRLFLKGFDELPGIVTLRDNLATVRHNVKVLTEDVAPAPPKPTEGDKPPAPAP
jgi:hypothetical protein